jgi:hypothetical protein
MMRHTVALLVTLVTVGVFAPSAHAGRFRALEGSVAIVLQDPRSLAVAEKGSLVVGLGELFGTDINHQVCEATATTIGGILNDPSDASTYVPSTVTCASLTVPEQQWLYVPAQGDAYAWTTLPANTYYSVVVTVTDTDAVAAARKGRSAVALAKLLGVSVSGRVNANLIAGITARLQARSIPFYCTTIPT